MPRLRVLFLYKSVLLHRIGRSSRGLSGRFGSGFQPTVEPAEEHTLPHDGVLRFENPVILVGEDKHFSRHTAQTGGIECHFALRREDAEIIFAVRDKNRSVPFVDKLVR